MARGQYKGSFPSCVGRGGAAIIIGLLLSGTAVSAEDEDASSERRGPPTRPFFLQLGYTPSQIFRADFRDEPGRVTVLHHDVSGTVIVPLRDRGLVNVTLSRDWLTYRFRQNELLEGILEDVRETQVHAVYMGRINPDWSLFAMGGIRWSAEHGASHDDARMQSGMILFQRSWLENLEVGVGMLAASRLDDKPLAIPMASINWDMTERLRLRTTRGLNLLYQLDEAGRWDLALNGEYHSRYVRLRDDGPAPSGIFRSRLIATTLAILYRPNPGVRLGAEIGFIPWRKITIRDENETTVFDSKTDPGLSAAFTASMTF